MKWVADRTGRFAKRPHYLPSELDEECEHLITNYLRDRHQQLAFPFSTDDLTVLIESLVENLDLYADLSMEGAEVEGVTDFRPGKRPRVRVSKTLSEDPCMANRFRTTLTHELGHVHFHTFLFNGEQSGDLFSHNLDSRSNKCNRQSMLQTAQTDWLEWQAGYACGAFLMPVNGLRSTVQEFIKTRDIAIARFGSSSKEGQALIQLIMQVFEVSRDAARVRLLQRGILIEKDVTRNLL